MHPRLARPAAALLLATLLPVTNLRAQDAPVTTFKVNTRIVVLDVVVTDKKGNVVTNLKQDDFTIAEDKEFQTIRSFEPPSAHALPSVEKPVVNSSADLSKIGDAPVTILVLDELNTHFSDMSFARQSMEKYLNAQPAVLRQPTTLLVASNTRFQVLHDYTQNRADLLASLKKHFPEYPWKLEHSGGGGPGAVERMAQSLSSLLQIAQASSGTPGRKNVIWVGVGFSGVNLINLDDQTASTLTGVVKRVTQTLLATRVTVNTIDPTIMTAATETTGDPDDPDNLTELVSTDPFGSDINFATFAPATGGQSFYSRNDVDNEIKTSIETANSYYTLSYSPTNRDEDAAKYRKIRIFLKDKNLIATTRDGYYPEQPNANNAAADPTLSKDRQKSLLQLDLSQAALSTMAYNGLTVSAQRAKDHIWHISVVAKGLEWATEPNESRRAEVTVIAAAFSAKDKTLGHTAREIPVETKPGDPLPDTAIIDIPFDIPPGAVRLRFVVRDATTGKIGTADAKP